MSLTSLTLRSAFTDSRLASAISGLLFVTVIPAFALSVSEILRLIVAPSAVCFTSDFVLPVAGLSADGLFISGLSVPGFSILPVDGLFVPGFSGLPVDGLFVSDFSALPDDGLFVPG